MRVIFIGGGGNAHGRWEEPRILTGVNYEVVAEKFASWQVVEMSVMS